MPESHDAGPEPTVARRALAADLSDEALLAELLALEPSARAQSLARLAHTDAPRAARLGTRLRLLGELGMELDLPPRTIELPTRFGPYERLERIGGGGMGDVYRARDVRDGRPVALKLLRSEHLWLATARARFRREIDSLARLDHVGLVRVFAHGEECGVPWLALEWIGGASLEEVLERLRGVPPDALGPRAFAEAVRASASSRPQAESVREDAFPGSDHASVVTHIVARAAEALAHAHAAGVLHRDVKPSNVLVTPAGRVLVIDFGLAQPRDADRMTRSGQWLGSLPYAAPEQLEGRSDALDARADVYSLGATLYELLTLRTPFLGGPESLVRRRILTGDLEAPRRCEPSLPRGLERVCLAALDPEPARRPESASDFAAELRRVLAGHAPRVRSTPGWLRARRWARRRPRAALVVAVAALGLVSLTTFAWRERVLAARVTRLVDLELVRALEQEAHAFWPAGPEHLEPMAEWLQRAATVLARAGEHQAVLDELAARSRALEPEDRARDEARPREALATLAREVDGLEVYVRTADRFVPAPPPAPEEQRAREAAVATQLVEDPQGFGASLRARLATLRAAMLADEALWRADVPQLDDLALRLENTLAELAHRVTFRFDDALDAWRHGALRRLVDDLAELARTRDRVQQQHEETRRLQELARGEGAERWAEARAAIAASPRYGGLELAPIFGLLPLGANERTGLWEFLHVASGSVPLRNAEGWSVDEQSGIVLVLLPGGRARVGREDGEPRLPIQDWPAQDVELAPYFLAAHELSAAQLERLGGLPTDRRRPTDMRLPLTLDWERARAVLRAHGLELPTEAQWEFAARTGGDAPLAGRVNAYDRGRLAARQAERNVLMRVAADFEDGFVDLAPIGSFRPDANGLFDLLGNAAEWCLDPFVGRGYATLPPRAGDGLRSTVLPAPLRVVRGGSFASGLEYLDPVARDYAPPGEVRHDVSVRAARSLAP